MSIENENEAKNIKNSQRSFPIMGVKGFLEVTQKWGVTGISLVEEGRAKTQLKLSFNSEEQAKEFSLHYQIPSKGHTILMGENKCAFLLTDLGIVRANSSHSPFQTLVKELKQTIASESRINEFAPIPSELAGNFGVAPGPKPLALLQQQGSTSKPPVFVGVPQPSSKFTPAIQQGSSTIKPNNIRKILDGHDTKNPSSPGNRR